MRRSLIVLFLLSLFASTMQGQSRITGDLRGRVTDPTTAVIAGASVTLTNVDTNQILTTSTDEAGLYTFARVAPGHYRLTLEKAGFQRAGRDGLTINVNEAAVADVVLPLGTVTQEVLVLEDTTGIQTQSSEISNVIDEEHVRELPLNGKDFLKLISLSPGVMPGTRFSGARGNNSFTLDGVDDNDERGLNTAAVTGGAAGLDQSAPNVISTEAVQEFRLISSNADATFGRGSGAQVTVITKSGGNTFHGSAYEFLRNDKLDARNFFNFGPFFDSKGRSIVPPFKQSLFGGTVSGPISKNRHFFFASYEGFRQRLKQTQSLVAPNGDLIGLIPGDLGRFFKTFFLDRGVIKGNGPGEFRTLTSTDRTAAINAGFNRALFDGDPSNGEAGTLLISTAPTRDLDQDSLFARTDHVFSQRTKASIHYGFAGPTQISATAVPLDLIQDSRRWQSAGAEVVYNLSSNQIFEIRGGGYRTRVRQSPLGDLESFFKLGVRRDVGIGITSNGTGLTALSVLGTNGFYDAQTVVQGSLSHYWTHGAWTLRSGLDIARMHFNIHNGAGRPSYTFNGIVGANGLLGTAPSQQDAVATSVAASVYGTNAGPTTALRGYRSTREEYFTQADWRARTNLTLNFGLRYTYFGVFSEVNHVIANLYATDGAGNIVPDANPFHFGRLANTVATVADGRPFYQPDRNNFQPRIGVAWNVGGAVHAVVRAAYGLYDDRIYQLIFSNFGGVVNNPPFSVASTASNAPFQLGVLPINPTIPVVVGVDPSISNAETHRVNVAFEKELTKGTILTAAYVGAFGRKLYGALQMNGGSGVPQTLRPDTRFSTETFYTNLSSSDYHALQLFAERRFARRFSFTSAYTYSKSKDDSSAETFASYPGLINLGASAAAGFQGGVPDQWAPRPRAADRGNSDFLARHSWTVSHLIDLPFGFTLAGILTMRSGEPVNLQLGSDVNDDGDTTDRPGLLSGTLNQLYARETREKTQFLIPRTDALTMLGNPTSVIDPFAMVPRNAIQRPSVKFYDVSLQKKFRPREGLALNIEVNAFNVFNRTNFSAPVATLSDARFGLITATAAGTNPRQLQLGMKLAF
jgi:Carboxypeptidase regulatory-like domain